MKQKIKLLACILVMSAGNKIYSQSVTWDVLRDDPFDIKNFSFAIDPIFVDMNGHNGYSFGWGLRAEHMMGKRLLANFDFRDGFGTKNYKKSNDNTRNYTNIEGGLGLILSNKSKRKNVPIILSQTTSGNTKTTVYIKGGVPANVRSIVAWRGGLSQYGNTLDYTKLTDSLLTIDGTPYSKAKSSKIFQDTVSGKTPVAIDSYGAIALTTVYTGFQFRTIRNLLIDVAGWGVRGNIIYSDFYIDFLYAPVIAIKKFSNPGGTEYKVDYTDKSHFGWRFGYFVRKPKEQGMSMKFEVGSRPGFKAPTNSNLPVSPRNMYFMFTMGLYVPFKIQPMYTGQ